MKKMLLVSLIVMVGLTCLAQGADLEIQGKKLVSKKPPFTVTLPSDLQFISSSSVENRGESSRTRTYLHVRERNKELEEILIVQIADKTDPQASPMVVPPLKPLAENRLLSRGRKKIGELEVQYLLQSMAWNPDAPSLQPAVKKGLRIPSHWALQGQCLFPYLEEHAVFLRYSKDVNALGLKVSEEGKHWEKGTISGNEKKAVELFEKSFMLMMESIAVKGP